MTAHDPHHASAGGMTSISQLLSRAFAMATMLGVLSALLAVFGTGMMLQRRYAHDNLQLLAQQAAYTAEIPIVFNDMTALRTSLERVLPADNVARFEVRDGRNIVMLEVDRRADGLTAGLVPRLFLPDPVTAPIVSSGTRIGTIGISSSSKGIGQLLLASLIGTILCICAILVGTRFIARRLNDRLVAPLSNIAEAAHAMRTDRRFDRRVPPARIAEVNVLSEDFNALLDELERWQGQMASMHKDLLHRASYDPLSGLLNRSAFVERIRDTIRSASRTRDRFALLFMDGDNFKRTNDDYGHAAGDAVICEVAARITTVLRIGDIAARVGGDEFAVLVHHLEQDDDARSVAMRIDEAMRSPIALSRGQKVEVGLSIGIAIYPDDGTDVDALIEAADSRMYAQKNARKGGGMPPPGNDDDRTKMGVSEQ